MRSFLIATLYCGLALADNTPPPAEKGFSLELSWSRQEQSRDSNGQSETWTLSGDKLSWTWSYSGYHPSRDFVRSKKKTVKVKDSSSLRAIIDKGKLAETRTVALGQSPHQSFTAALRVTRGGKTTTLTFSGGPSENAPADWERLQELRAALATLMGET